MTTSTEYNGWTNYETWAVKLWLDNEPDSYYHWQHEAKSHREFHEHDRDKATYELAALLKSEHEDALPDLEGFAADLLNAALSEVDWHEIATSLIEEPMNREHAPWRWLIVLPAGYLIGRILTGLLTQ